MIQKLQEKTLLWIAETFKIDAEYFIRGSFWQSIAQIVGTLTSVATSVAFANILSKETYGTYSYVISVFGLLSIVGLSGMDAAITQSVARGLEGSVMQSLITRIRWGFLGALLGIFIGGYYWSEGNTQLAQTFFLASAFIPFLDSLTIFYDVLKGRKEFDSDAKFSIFVQIVNAAAIIATLFVTQNLFAILISYFISYTLCHAFLLWYMLKKYPLNAAKNPEMIPYGKFMTFIRGITSAAAYLDKIVLFNFVSAADVAIYSIAVAPVSKIMNFLGTIPTLALPRFAEYEKARIKKELMGKVFKFSLITIGVILLYILLIKYLFIILFPTYQESVFYSQLYALTLIGMPLSLVYTYFQAQMLTNIILPYKITIHILQIALLFICIYFWGLLGAIIARILGQLVGIPLILFFFKRS